jgi:hypothetical protein
LVPASDRTLLVEVVVRLVLVAAEDDALLSIARRPLVDPMETLGPQG